MTLYHLNNIRNNAVANAIPAGIPCNIVLGYGRLGDPTEY